MSGTPPTEKELELVNQFKINLGTILETEEQRSAPYLLRWIRARDGSLDKAEAMLRNSLKWRKDNDIDNALTKPVDTFIQNLYPYHTMGHDNQGRAVRQVHSGFWDMRKVIETGKEKEFQHFINSFFESIMIAIKNSGNLPNVDPPWPQTQFVYICDWEGFQYSQLLHRKAIQNILKFASSLEAHYPEILNCVYFVNCPSFMPIFMKMVKPLLAPKTYAKIQIFGSNKEEWQPVLKGVMSLEMLWTRFGGNKELDDANKLDTEQIDVIDDDDKITKT